MEVILLEKVRKLGDLGDKVKVKAGFGRNFLIPQHKAAPATVENIAKFETMRSELETRAATALQAAQARAERLNTMSVTVQALASDEGKLYGSIAARDVAEAITAANEAVEKHEVEMPEGAIHAVGEYKVTLRVHTDVSASVKVIVESVK